MDRVRGIATGGDGFLPVLKTALSEYAHVDDRPVHKILCGIAKAHAVERVSDAEQSEPVLKGKENQN